MQISKRYFASIMLLTLLTGLAIGYGITNIRLHQEARVRVNVFVFAEKADGVETLASGNLITDIGESYVANILGWNNVTNHNATKYITVSNDASPAASWTQLATEKTADGFIRATGTVSDKWFNSGDAAYNVTNKFTSSSDSITLQCAGLQWSGVSASDNNLFAAAAFTQTTFNTNDNCTIKWVITWNAN